jgi:hypothetical protein
MNRTPHPNPGVPAWLPIVQSQIGSLRYGVVQIVVHDSRVVQVERTERIRLGAEGTFIPSTNPSVHQTPETRNRQPSELTEPSEDSRL